MALRGAVFAGLCLGAAQAHATVYENGRSGVSNWRVSGGKSPQQFISTRRDSDRGQWVVALNATPSTVLHLGGKQRWDNRQEKFLSWHMKTDDRFSMYVVLRTTRGLRYLRYTNSDKSLLRYKSKYIDHGLGSAASDGRWQLHVRDLQADLSAGERGNKVVAVNGIMFRADPMLLDGVKLHRTLSAARAESGHRANSSAASKTADAGRSSGGSSSTSGSSSGSGSSSKASGTPSTEPARKTTSGNTGQPVVAAAKPQPQPQPQPQPVPKPAAPKPSTGGASGPVLAFPGAEGFGRFAKGGRGGRVVIVNTLEDVVSSRDGKVSLREALTTMSGPRTVVFDVAGVFDTGRETLVMSGEADSRVTVACQTAPSPGVLIRGSGIRIRGGAHDIVMRHCGIRNIDPGAPASESSRAIGVVGTGGLTGNMIFDHMSLGWASDENFTVFLGPTAKSDLYNVTLSRSIIGEGDADSSHSESGQLPRRYLHAMGPSCNSASYKYRIKGCSIIGNLMAHNARRNPLMWGVSGEVLNNVVYNWHETALDARAHRAGRIDLHVRGNVFKSGPTSKRGNLPMKLIDSGSPATNFRAFDNRFVDGATRRSSKIGDVSRGKPERPRNAAAPMNLDCVGASRPRRSAFDERMLAEYRDGTGQVGIEFSHRRDYRGHEAARHPRGHDTDRDGMADAWETRNGLDPNDPNDHRGDLDRDGYTNIEEYLAELGNC